jgi:hypothetical protein
MDSIRKFRDEKRLIEAFHDGLTGKPPPLEIVASYQKGLSEEEKKRKEDEQKRVSQQRVEAQKLTDEYREKMKNAINYVDNLFLSISLQLKDNPDLEAGIVELWRMKGWKVNSLVDVYEASKTVVVESIRRELAEASKNNPYVWPNFI